jgi:hypothetical protein
MSDPKEIEVNVMGEVVTVLDYGDGVFMSKPQGGGFDTPENRLRDIAVAFAIESLAQAYKRAPKVIANRQNAAKPRKRRMTDPTPEEVAYTMRKLKFVDSQGRMLVSTYRKALLAEIIKSYPATNEPKLDRRLDAAKNMRLIQSA